MVSLGIMHLSLNEIMSFLIRANAILYVPFCSLLSPIIICSGISSELSILIYSFKSYDYNICYAIFQTIPKYKSAVSNC